MKYIDADKLKAEIRKLLIPTVHDRDYDEWEHGKDSGFIEAISIIESLQQEQPEVEQDIANVVKSYFDVQELEDVKITTTGIGLLNFAKHIKKIVLSSAFILYNHITENSGNKTLDNEIDATIKMNDLWGGLLPNTLIKYTAHHFYELDRNARKED